MLNVEVPPTERFMLAIEAVEEESQNGLVYSLGAHILQASSLRGQLPASH